MLALIFMAGLLLIGSLGASASGGAPINLLPTTMVKFKGWTSPAKLSGKAPKPVTLHLEGSISSADGSQIPALEALSLQFDKSGAIFTKGLPTCSIDELESEVEHPKPPCQKALVGRGYVSVHIYFPEDVDLTSSGPLQIFNGRPKNGHPVLIYKLYIHLRAATTLLSSGEILTERGKLGTQTSIKIPKIVRGLGSILSFKAALGRSWTYKGKKVSLFTASCPKGSLAARAEFDFVGGEKGIGDIENKCS